jgi:hypothetical protein
VAACEGLASGGDDAVTLRFCAVSSSVPRTPTAPPTPSMQAPSLSAQPPVPASQSASTSVPSASVSAPAPRDVDADVDVDVDVGERIAAERDGSGGCGSAGSVIPPHPAKRQSLSEYRSARGSSGGGDLAALMQQTKQMVETAPPRARSPQPVASSAPHSPPVPEAPSSPDIWGDAGVDYDSDDMGADIVPHVIYGWCFWGRGWRFFSTPQVPSLLLSAVIYRRAHEGGQADFEERPKANRAHAGRNRHGVT